VDSATSASGIVSGFQHSTAGTTINNTSYLCQATCSILIPPSWTSWDVYIDASVYASVPSSTNTLQAQLEYSTSVYTNGSVAPGGSNIALSTHNYGQSTPATAIGHRGSSFFCYLGATNNNPFLTNTTYYFAVLCRLLNAGTTSSGDPLIKVVVLRKS
jgi:hypothetical protein